MSGHDDATLSFYARTAETYVSSGSNGESRHFAGFEKRLPRAAKILELGCGGGRDARAFMAAGHNVDATDGTADIAAIAQKFIQAPVRVMRFEELEATRAYDAVWANASLLHVPRDGLVEILMRIHRALKPGGWHLASFKAGGQEGRDAFGRYYNYPSSRELQDFYAQAADWQVHQVTSYQGGGYQAAQLGPWVAITVRKRGE